MSVFHNVKRGLSVYKPKAGATKDAEFDSQYTSFKDISKQATGLLGALKSSASCYSSVQANISQTLSCVASSCNEGRAKTLANDGTSLLDDFIIEAKELHVVKVGATCRVAEAINLLNDYLTQVVKCKNMCKTRNELVKDLDYYLGKVEDMRSKNSSKPKDQDRLRRAEIDLSHYQTEYEKSNAAAVELLKKVVEFKEKLFLICTVAYMDMVRQTMALNPFNEVNKNYNDILDVAWYDMDGMTVGYRGTAPNTIASVAEAAGSAVVSNSSSKQSSPSLQRSAVTSGTNTNNNSSIFLDGASDIVIPIAQPVAALKEEEQQQQTNDNHSSQNSSICAESGDYFAPPTDVNDDVNNAESDKDQDNTDELVIGDLSAAGAVDEDKENSKSESDNVSSLTTKATTTTTTTTATKNNNQVSDADKVQQQQQIPRNTPKSVKALYDFEAEHEEELSFSKGDTVILYEVVDDQWMFGELNGKQGVFPCNYVQTN